MPCMTALATTVMIQQFFLAPRPNPTTTTTSPTRITTSAANAITILPPIKTNVTSSVKITTLLPIKCATIFTNQSPHHHQSTSLHQTPIQATSPPLSNTTSPSMKIPLRHRANSHQHWPKSFRITHHHQSKPSPHTTNQTGLR